MLEFHAAVEYLAIFGKLAEREACADRFVKQRLAAWVQASVVGG